MKIYAARRDELIAERDAYDAETQQYQNRVDEGERRWRRDTNAIADAIKEEVIEAIGDTSLQLDVYVHMGWNHGYEVNVKANEHNKFEDNVALSWSWDASIDTDGSLKKDSGSWSGLKAITSEQIADLEESVRVMKILNSMDWERILKRAVPSTSDYISDEDRQSIRDRKNNRRDFDTEIFEAELEDAIAAGEWIKMNGRPGTDYYRESRRGDYYVKIDKMTGRFVNCHIINASNPNYQTDERIAKAKIYPYIIKPIETAQF